jgi:putative ABC transport system substrate-binding protein
MRRIGVLTNLEEADPELKGWLTAFQVELQKLGWAQGRNISFEYRWPGSDEQRLQSSAADLVKAAPGVIFAAATPALVALYRESRSLPIVFVQVSDPVKLGFVATASPTAAHAPRTATPPRPVALFPMELTWSSSTDKRQAMSIAS